MFKSLSVRVVLALILGVGVGAAVRARGDAGLEQGMAYVEAFGGLWLNALRMTVVPLVFSLIVNGIASVADASATGRLASRAVGLFVLLLFTAAIYAVVATTGLLSLWPIDREAAQAFLASPPPGGGEAAAPPSFIEWFQSLAPANVIRAAAEESIVALVVFAVFFGFAITRLAPAAKEHLTQFFRAITDAMIVIVHWVLVAAPIGVFALALGVGMRAGLGAVATIAHYVAIVSIATIGITIVAFILAVVWGRVPLPKFAAAAAAPIAVAFSTQSSLASLPAMLEAARRDLGIAPRITDLVLPLAVTVFRFTSPVANLAVALFLASLYGLSPAPLQFVSAIFVAFVVSIASVGLPGQVSYMASLTPICIALGVPLDLLVILWGVEVIPDIFRTIGNVSGDLAVTTILRDKTEPNAPAAESSA